MSNHRFHTYCIYITFEMYVYDRQRRSAGLYIVYAIYCTASRLSHMQIQLLFPVCIFHLSQNEMKKSNFYYRWRTYFGHLYNFIINWQLFLQWNSLLFTFFFSIKNTKVQFSTNNCVHTLDERGREEIKELKNFVKTYKTFLAVVAVV